MLELTRKVYGSYSLEGGKVNEFWFNLFCAAVAAERESELYEIANEKTRFNMDKNEMKIVEAKTIADVCNTLSEILEELKKIHDVLQRRDQK